MVTVKRASFSVAIKATKNAILSKEKKLQQVKSDFELSADYVALLDLIDKLSYQMGLQSYPMGHGKKADRAAAGKEFNRLDKEIKRLRKLDTIELIDVEMSTKSDLLQLKSELSALSFLAIQG